MALSEASVHATLPASDFERARSFYAERLGLSQVSELPNGRGTFYECAHGSRFLVFPSAGTATGTHTQAVFVVADIEAEVADLQQRGVVFEEYDLPGLKTERGIATIDTRRGAFFKDSEGNLLALVQLAAP